MRTLGWIRETLAQEPGLMVRADLAGREDASWIGTAIDSRVGCQGRVFFALAGERTDGHRYVDAARAAGAVAAVVSDAATADRLAGTDVPYVLVSETAASLRVLGRRYRSELDLRVVAITGSAGKTTTKEYTRSVLRSMYRVYSNRGNLNSLIGVPMTILETDPENQYLVCEVGANEMGEVRALGEMLRPHVAVITNIGDAHIGRFGSRDNIASAKSELLESLEPSDYAVLPRDDDYYDLLRKVAACKVVTFGESELADCRVTDITLTETGSTFHVGGERFALPVPGRHNVLNACAAVAVGEVCGVDAERIREALSGVAQSSGRGTVLRAAGVTVVDDTYNASPASMRSAVAMLKAFSAQRRIAVLGDMKELGDYSDGLHRDLGGHLATSGMDAVFWVGAESETVRAGFDAAGGKCHFDAFDDADAALPAVLDLVADGDVVLAKASRACGLDALVEKLIEALENR